MTSKSQPWPREGRPANFSELTEPVCEAIRFAYEISRRNKRRSIPWIGLTLGERELAGCPPPHEKLGRSYLEYSEHHQGRDALDELVGIAVQLGIEQGRRLEGERLKGSTDIATMLAKAVLRQSSQAAEAAEET